MRKSLVFSDKVTLNSDGLIISCSEHNYVWLKYSVLLENNSKEMSLEQITCDIELLLSISSFPALLKILEICLMHNFLSCVLMKGAGIMASHYQELIKLFRLCPQVMATGSVSTGKSASIQAALSLFGADNPKNHYMKCSKAFCLLVLFNIPKVGPMDLKQIEEFQQLCNNCELGRKK